MAKSQLKKSVESVTYNTRVRSFPDGTKQFYHSSRNYHRAGDEEKAVMEAWNQANFDYFRSMYPDLPDWCISAMCSRFVHDGSSVERKKVDNMKRAVQVVYNIAKSNEFDYFVTFTFNPQVVDSFDYDSCVFAVRQWMDCNRKRGIKWLIVPEQHDSGRYHFHALVQGQLRLQNAVNSKTGMPMMDKAGRPIYNVGDYKWGFTTATVIGDRKRTASYIAKYLSKDITVPKGRKRYWASYGLDRPEEELQMMNDWSFAELVAQSRFFKDTTNDWGNFWLAEVDFEG